MAKDTRFEKIKELDSAYVMHTYGRLPVAFVKGSGSRLWDTAGKEYIDLMSGLGVTILGHSHPRVTAAIAGQAGALLHTTNLYYVEPQDLLAELLVSNSFEGKCFFCNSGAEANEGALKLARKHHFMAGGPRSKIVCALSSFHGRTMATLSATGQPAKWAPFSPTLPGFEHVTLNDVGGLEKAVDSDTAAVLLEPIQGEGGVHPATDEYLEAARDLCDRSGALLIFDEVQTGLGRTGDLFAWQSSGVVPDVMTLAKGLANGVPVGTFIARGEYAEVLEPGDHGSTFGGNFIACAAGHETIKVVLEEGLPARAAKLGVTAKARLEEIVSFSSAAVEVRGRGLMLALQLSSDSAGDIVLKCLEKGVLVNQVTPSAVRLLPALTIPEGDLARGIEVLAEIVGEGS
jgi:acetylornithine/N-succinyldiaminopimelate aminotransferase